MKLHRAIEIVVTDKNHHYKLLVLSTPPDVKHGVCHWRISLVSHENDFLHVSSLWLKHREILLKMSEVGCLQKLNTGGVFVSPLGEIMMGFLPLASYLYLWINKAAFFWARCKKKKNDIGIEVPVQHKNSNE